MKRYVITGAVLGIVAGIAGCSGAPDSKGDTTPIATGSAADISAQGPATVNGCASTQVFDITASEPIDTIAVDALNNQNLDMQLYSVDQEGNMQQVNQNEQDVSSSLQALLQKADSSFSNSASSSASDSHSASHIDSSSLVSENKADQSANQSAWNQTGNSSSDSSHTANQSNDSSNTTDGFGNIGTDNSSHSDSSDSADAHQDASMTASNAASASSSDTLSSTMSQNTSSDQANDAMAQNSASQGAQSSDATQQAQANTSRAMAFTNLSNLASNHYVLQVNSQATNNAQQLRLYAVRGSDVAGQNAFDQSLPACVDNGSGQ